MIARTTGSVVKERRSNHGSVAEIVPCLFLLLFALFFPVLDLLSFLSAVVTVNYVALTTSRAASKAATFAEATNITANIANQAAALGRFSIMKPMGGVNNTGVSLLIEQHDVPRSQTETPKVVTIEPSKESKINIDRSKYVYFYRAVATFEVLPVFNFAGSSIFGLGEIPGLGKPVLLTYSSSATIEHPEGLNERDATQSR